MARRACVDRLSSVFERARLTTGVEVAYQLVAKLLVKAPKVTGDEGLDS